MNSAPAQASQLSLTDLSARASCSPRLARPAKSADWLAGLRCSGQLAVGRIPIRLGGLGARETATTTALCCYCAGALCLTALFEWADVSQEEEEEEDRHERASERRYEFGRGERKLEPASGPNLSRYAAEATLASARISPRRPALAACLALAEWNCKQTSRSIELQGARAHASTLAAPPFVALFHFLHHHHHHHRARKKRAQEEDGQEAKAEAANCSDKWPAAPPPPPFVRPPAEEASTRAACPPAGRAPRARRRAAGCPGARIEPAPRGRLDGALAAAWKRLQSIK